MPKNAEDFKRVMQQLTQPSANRWAIGSFQGKNTGSFEVAMFASIFGAPNGWRLESDGKLTKDIETPEFKETVGYVRDLFASGVFHPNTTTWASGVIARPPCSRSAVCDPARGHIRGPPWRKPRH